MTYTTTSDHIIIDYYILTNTESTTHRVYEPRTVEVENKLPTPSNLNFNQHIVSQPENFVTILTKSNLCAKSLDHLITY